jgi:autotransporter-associated beta strand protein
MRAKRSGLVRAAALGFCVAVIGGSTAVGQTYTWTGNGSDNNWNNASNWSGEVPVSGANTTLVFAGSTRTTPFNDFGNGAFSTGRLEFASGAAAFTLQGDNFGFLPYLGNQEQQIFQNSSSTQSIGVGEFSFRPGADSRINLNAGDLEFTSTVYLDAHDSQPRQLTITGDTMARHTLVLSGALNVGGQESDVAPFISIQQNKRLLVEGSLNLHEFSFVSVYDGVLEFSGSGSMPSAEFIEIGNDNDSFNAAIWLSTGGLTLSQPIDFFTAPDSRATIGGLNTSGTVTYAGELYVAENSGAIDFAAAAGGTIHFTGDRDLSSVPVYVNRPDGDVTYDGTIVFSGNATASGNTTVFAGTLEVSGGTGPGGNAGALGSGTVSIGSGGQVTYWLSAGDPHTISNAFALSGGTLYTEDGSNTFSGAIALADATTSTISARYEDTITLSGGLSGSGNVIFAQQGGTGAWSAPTYVLTAAGTNTGSVRVTGSSNSNATILQLAHVNALQDATLDMATADEGVVQFTVAGNNTYTLGGLAGTRNLSIGGNALRVGGNDQDTEYSGALARTGSGTGLIKEGDGILTLGGTNTYGDTTIEAGTLVVDGSVDGGIAIGSAGALGGDGTVAGSVSFLAGADFVFDPTTTLTVNDGSVTFGGFSIANIIGLSSSTPEDTYTLIGGNATFDFTNVSNLEDDPYDLGSGKFAYFQPGSLQLVVVPEPGTVLIGGAAAVTGWLVLARRARKRS